LKFNKVVGVLEGMLSQDRLDHSIRVAETAMKMAAHWSENAEDAYLAGLVHDIAKFLTEDNCKELGIDLSGELLEIYEEFQPIWHAFVAPLVIPKKLQITAPDILNAAKFHTTGRANMTALEKILFVSDFTEPRRPFSECNWVRELAQVDLDQAVFALSNFGIRRLLKRGLKIHPFSIECRNYLCSSLPPETVKKITQKVML